MAVLTKDQPSPVDTKSFKNGYYTKKNHKFDRKNSPLPKSDVNYYNEVNYDKNPFKGRRCANKNQKSSKHPNPPQIKGQSDHQDKKVPLMKYDKNINTSYTPFTLIVHIIIIYQHIYTLYSTPASSVSRMRLASFTQLVYLTTTCFHIATLLANVFKKIKLERAFVLYGTWLIWIGWAMCLWFIRPENRPDSLYKALNANGGFVHYINRNDSIDMDEIEYLLTPMDTIPFLMNGKWKTTTLPIISFFLLLVIRRQHWGLITWEYLVLLDYSSTLKWYRTWCVAGAGASWMLTWEAAKLWLRIPLSESTGNMVLYRTDLPTYPGLFNVLCVSSLAGLFMVCWWSFWTFQYRGVIWKKEFREGIAVWSSDGWMRVGGIGC